MKHAFPILATALLAALIAAGLAWGGQPGQPATDDDPTSPALEQRIDAATEKGLAHLAKRQQANGDWGNGNFGCATTSLVVLAFMAKGYQPGEQPYGSAIEKGIDFVVSQQKPNGLIAANDRMYGHGISTLMLGEVVGHTTGMRNQQVKDCLAKAVKLILDAQKVVKPPAHRGGWRYQPTSEDSDISVSGWQLMALRAAKNAGADVPAAAIEEAIVYIKRSACPGGGFAYQPGGEKSSLARAGTGIVALELCGRHHAKESLAAGDWILANPVGPLDSGGGEGHPYYRMYYCSQAMYQLGGRYWTQFWPAFAAAVLKEQLPDGSFPPSEVGSEARAGPVYSTSMAVLALSVRYRLLPIYQK